MTVCFFGNYIYDYPRVQVMRKGLRLHGVQVVECHTRERGWRKYYALWRAHHAVRGRYDVLFICMGGQTLALFAKALTRKRIILDAFVSSYLTNVEDRRTVRRQSLYAWYYWLVDALTCRIADHTLLDTEAQIDYFTDTFHVPRRLFSALPVGADDEVFFPSQTAARAGTFKVHWHGHIVPFHGVEHIIAAARLLRGHHDIEFGIVTRFTRAYERLRSSARAQGDAHLSFFPETDYQGLVPHIQDADVCLGVFHGNHKTNVVIPNKIFEAAACRKPVITAKSKAVGEWFHDRESIIAVPADDPRALADAILLLKGNPVLCKEIGQRAYEIFRQRLTPAAIGKTLAAAVHSFAGDERSAVYAP